MIVYGLDFTSVPTSRKPITCAACTLLEETLRVDDFLKIRSFADFEAFLRRGQDWVAGFDFPFGQARRLITGLGWPNTWEGYVGMISTMSRDEFGRILEAYRNSRQTGDKQPLRIVDAKAGSCSPMMWFGVPVGKMFFEGAPRLRNAPVSIQPCRPTDDPRVVVEAYPALVARKWIGRRGYKSDTRSKQTPDKEAARGDIVSGLRSQHLRDHYGFSLDLNDALARDFIRDPSGDNLDALLCAIQAAWAYTQRNAGYGIPGRCDPVEGWIVDPAMLQQTSAATEERCST